MQEAVIVSAVRTPTGKFLGSLKTILGDRSSGRWSYANPSAEPASIPPSSTNASWETSSPPGSARRQHARRPSAAGCRTQVAALTINKVCGSGLKAVMLASQGIAAGDIDVAVAGGMESMSNAPYLLDRVREGLRMGNGQVIDSMIHDGLWCSFEQCHMGHAGEIDRHRVPCHPRTSRTRSHAAAIEKRPRQRPPGDSLRRSCQFLLTRRRARHFWIATNRFAPTRASKHWARFVLHFVTTAR